MCVLVREMSFGPIMAHRPRCSVSDAIFARHIPTRLAAMSNNAFAMLHASDVMKSPAAPSAVLLYGIVFLFALAYYLGTPWRQTYTITLYLGVSAWAAVVALDRLRQRRRTLNRIDFLFAAFLASVLLSTAVNWWEGTIQYLKLIPFFFLLPYVLGRVMHAEDGLRLRNMLIGMGVLLLPLIFPEYLRILMAGYPYENSPAPMLFGQGHGVMLSGLLLSVTFLGLVSVVLSPSGPHGPAFLTSEAGRYFSYALLVAIVVTMGWISSRGSIVAGILGVSILFLLSPASTRRRKLEILLVLALALGLAVVHSLQRKHNWEYYTSVVKPPVGLESLVGDMVGSSRQAAPTGSILGEVACKRIVDSVSDRWLHYEQALALFLAKPLFGAGANHYGFYACTGPGSFPHSTLLQVFAELGGIVGLTYCALIWMTLHTFFGSRRRQSLPDAKPVWVWFAAFSAMQVLIAQLNGHYFISAALYFVMGVAASARDSDSIAVEGR